MWGSSRPPSLFISGRCLLIWMASRTFRGKYSVSRSIMWKYVKILCLPVEMPTVSLRKFTEQSGRKSHNKENQTTVCDEWTLSFCYPTKLINLFHLDTYWSGFFFKFKRFCMLNACSQAPIKCFSIWVASTRYRTWIVPRCLYDTLVLTRRRHSWHMKALYHKETSDNYRQLSDVSLWYSAFMHNP